MNAGGVDYSLKLDEVAQELRLIHATAPQALEALERGKLPARAFVHALSSACASFDSLRSNLEAKARQLDMEPTFAGWDDDPSIEDLRMLLVAIEHRALRQDTLVTLDAVLALRHRNLAAFEPLAALQRRAGAAREQLLGVTEETAPDAEAIGAERAAFNLLLSLVRDGGTMDDEQLDQMSEDVATHFGLKVAFAVARGQLVDPAAQHPSSPPEDLPAGRDTALGWPQGIDVPAGDSAPSAPSGAQGIAESREVPPQEAAPQSSPVSSTQAPTSLGVHAEILPVAEPPGAGTVPLLPIVASDATADRSSTSLPETKVVRSRDARNAEVPVAVRRALPELTISADLRARARKIQLAPRRQRPVFAFDLIWHLLQEDALGIAHILATAIQGTFPDVESPVPPWVIRAAALSRAVRTREGLVADALLTEYTSFSPDHLVGSVQSPVAINLMLVAATLHASLIAPDTGAGMILGQLAVPSALPQLAECQQLLAANMIALDWGTMRQSSGAQQWETERQQLSDEITAWLARQQAANLSFHRATEVWRRWQEPGQLIAQLLPSLNPGADATIETVRKALKRIDSSAMVDKEVRATDTSICRRVMPLQIEGLALNQLRERIRQAADFARHWIALERRRTDQSSDYRGLHTAQMLNQLTLRLKALEEELAREVPKFLDPAEHAAAQCCLSTCRALRELLREPGSTAEPALHEVLRSDLLRIPGLLLDSSWEPSVADPAVMVESVIRLLASGRENWADVVSGHLDVEDYETADWILEHLSDQVPLRPEVATLQQRFRDARVASQRRLQDEVAAAKVAVETSFTRGLLTSRERDSQIAAVTEVEQALPTARRFATLHADLASIQQALTERATVRVADMRAQIGVAAINRKHQSFAEIENALRSQDVFRAAELLDRAASGTAEVPKQSTARIFDAFFPDAVLRLSDFCEGQPDWRNKIIPDLRLLAKGQLAGRHYTLGPVQLSDVPGAQVGEAAEMLQAWFAIKGATRPSAEQLETLLRHIGFSVEEVVLHDSECQPSKATIWATMRTAVLHNRNLCPVPAYGSSARGQYRLICVFERSATEDLLEDVGDTTRSAPVIMLYFARMTERRRREVARLCWEQRRTLVILDEILLIFLCGQRGSRLAAFFACTLPFTFLEPYTTAAGLVPEEMFFGRDQEQADIERMEGSAFVYGGRQLGKTALLRAVVRQRHAPSEGRVVLWIDLKDKDVGLARPISAIWTVLAEALHKEGIYDGPLGDMDGHDRVLASIEAWLAADSRRSLLVLLDEADRFLEGDGRAFQELADGGGRLGFPHSTHIKGLMDRTQRRFKAVFTGLHNVQRMTREANHTLAHMGRPLCIGPLREDGQWQAARELITRPLEALGFRFASEDLISQILSQTNYYPSLIQLFCQQLLRHVTNPHTYMFDVRNSPPYQITAQHVTDAYRNGQLRADIRDRFMWTLALDRRYKIIAFCMALASRARSSSQTERWIRDQAMGYWPSGFESVSSPDSFRVLLSEMVGLGILRETEPGYYALLTPNVAELLGTDEQVEDELLASVDPMEVQQSPVTLFRRAIHGVPGGEPIRWSPLTGEQEGRLSFSGSLRAAPDKASRAESDRLGLSVIVGCPAAGSAHISMALQAALNQTWYIVQPETPPDGSVGEWLQPIMSAHSGHDLAIEINAAILPWQPGWLNEARMWLLAAKDAAERVQVIFVADPIRAWELLEAEGSWEHLGRSGIDCHFLLPWHAAALERWLEDWDAGPRSAVAHRQVTTATGNWPLLLDLFYRRAHSEPTRWADCLNAVSSMLRAFDQRSLCSTWWGLDQAAPRSVLDVLAAIETPGVPGIPRSELQQYVDGMSEEMVDRSLLWAEALGLVRLRGPSLWTLDPLVRELLLDWRT